MNTRDFLLTAWDWQPSVVIGCAILLAAYFTITRRLDRNGATFVSGVAVLLLALASPLDALGDEYLLSAHVVQHFLLGVIVPALFVLGAPRNLPEMPLWLSNPWIGWPLGAGSMLVWHVPAVFNAALASEPLHITQHLELLMAGTLFWWPIFGQSRLSTAGAVAYLFTACTACSLMGAALTFGPTGAYPAYLHANLPLIRETWGIDVKSDQQLAGMLMWVPGCFVYLGAILLRVKDFYTAPAPAAIAL